MTKLEKIEQEITSLDPKDVLKLADGWTNTRPIYETAGLKLMQRRESWTS